MLDSIIIRVHLQSFNTDNEYGAISADLYKALGGDTNEARLRTRSGMIVAFVDKYWSLLRCGEYNSYSIANLLMEWCYAYGKPTVVIKQLQSKLSKTTNGQKLGLAVNGTMDDKTLAALKAQPAEAFFKELKDFRIAWYNKLVENDPSQKVYLDKWLQRMNAVQFGMLTNFQGSITTFSEDGQHSSVDSTKVPSTRIYSYSKIDILAPFIFSYAGGYMNDGNGNITNMGISLPKWRIDGIDLDRNGSIDEEDLKLVTEGDAYNFLKRNFWDKLKATKIKSQNVANMLVDWAWEVGVREVILQLGFEVPSDGYLSDNALWKINSSDPKGIFQDVYAIRKDYYSTVVKNDVQKKKYHASWLRRLNNLQFNLLICKDGQKISFSDLPAREDKVYGETVTEMNSYVKDLFGKIY